MGKITINLLPIEFRSEELKKIKFYKIQFIGIGIVLLTIFLASLTVALRVLQSQNIARASSEVEKSQTNVESYKESQAALLFIKNRLTTLNQVEKDGAKQYVIYQKLNELLPSTLLVSSLSIDKSNNVSVIASVADAETLENTIDNLIFQDDSFFQEMSVDSLGKSREGDYRVSFKLKLK